jgi:hypothetical protein
MIVLLLISSAIFGFYFGKAIIYATMFLYPGITLGGLLSVVMGCSILLISTTAVIYYLTYLANDTDNQYPEYSIV